MLSKRRNRIAVSLLLVFAFAAMAHGASAKEFTCPPKPTKAQKTRRLAGKYFKKGEKFFVAQKYNAAIDRFLCSMAMVEHENTVFNISQSAAEAEDKQRAHEALTAYLEAHPDSTTKVEIQEVIDGLADELGLNEPEPEPEPTPEPEPEPEPMPEPMPEPEPQNSVKPLRISGIATAGAGVVGLAMGGVFFGLAGSSREKAETAADFDVYQRHKDDWESRNRAGNIAMITGSVLVIAGGALFAASFIVEGSEAETKGESAELAVLPTGRGLVLTGGF